MKATPTILVLLALVAMATCYRPPPPRYLPPPSHHRRPHPPSFTHQSAARYPARPRPPFPRQPIAAPPRFAPNPLQFKDVQHVVVPPYHLQQVDDDSGPIHTIPAPKLGPHDRPAHHHSTGPFNAGLFNAGPFNAGPFNAGPFNEIPQRVVGEQPRPSHPGVHQEQHFLSHQQAYLESNDVAGRTADGTHAYYAPDPDPSLPTARIPPTHDPHSSPSNGRPPPADLLPVAHHHQQHHAHQWSNHDNNNNQQHQTVDSYGVPVVLHSFNYQEPYRRSTNQNAALGQETNPTVEEAYFAANQRQDHAPQEAESVASHAQQGAEQGDEEKAAFFDKVDGPVYSVLPNQEVAETLATLAAAGNINSNLISKAKDVQEAEDYVEEEILKAGPLEPKKDDDDREYVTDEDKEVQLVFGTRLKQ